MSGLVSSLPRPVRQRGSRAAHRCCTRVTNFLLQCTQWPRWTREWLAPNTIGSTQTQQLQQGRGFASDTKAVGAAAASDAATAPAATEAAASASAYFPSAAIASAAPPSVSGSASADARSPRRVRHVLFTVHGYLGLPRPFFLFRAPAVNQGFYTVDFSYSSGDDLNTIAQQLGETVRATIAQLSERERAKAKANRGPQHYMRNNQQPQHSTQPPAEELRLNFVCHSMGGLVLRAAISSGLIPATLPEEAQAASGPSGTTAAASGSRFAALADQPAESDDSDALLPVTMGRVVMIATPNRGSLYARTLARIPGVKRVVLSFASMSVPNPRHVVDWMGGAIKGSGWRNLLSGAPSADSASSSSVAPPDASASGVLPDVLACGDLMMSRSADWFCTHLSWPRELYPRTLVIAGTMGLNNLLPRPHDGTIALEETILPLPSDAEAVVTKQPSARSSGSASSADSEHADAAFAAAATTASKSSRRVALSTAGSLHMSFHAPHSALVAHPGVIASSLQFLLTGDAEPPQRRSHWD